MNWLQLRKLILRGPDPVTDPYRLAFDHVKPEGAYDRAHVPWQRTRGGDAEALGVPYPFNNPIGAGIVYQDPMGIFGPPPAQYSMGAFFFLYPTPGQAITEVVQPGGPLLDPATLAAMVGAPMTGEPVTTPAVGAAQAGAQRMGMSF